VTEQESDDGRSYWMTLRKREGTGHYKHLHNSTQ